jgi:hypothetical protein
LPTWLPSPARRRARWMKPSNNPPANGFTEKAIQNSVDFAQGL